jgi:hypothetical protein
MQTGRPKMIPAQDPDGQDLKPKSASLMAFQTSKMENEQIRKTLEARLKEVSLLTVELSGDLMTKKRGLREKITLERQKRQGLIDEQGIEESLLINADVESELILKRRELLEKRIAELRRYLKIKYNVDMEEKGR